MKPEKIVPQTEVPSFRDDLIEVLDHYETDEEITDENIIYLPEENVLIKVEKCFMDFEVGKEVANMCIETERFQLHMRVESMFVSDKIIKFYGWREDSNFQIFP
jgi:hypothetical protein